MAGFEDVILRALEKEQPVSALVREQIYNSARATLINMLNKSGKLSPDNILKQQQKLEIAISNIELSYGSVDAQVHGVAPEFGVPNIETSAIDSDERLASRAERPKPKSVWRRPFSMLLFSAIIVAALGISAWWIYDQELTKSAEQRDNSVPNPPKILAEESSDPDDGTRVNNDANNTEWVTIFDTSDPIGLITPTASTAALSKDDSGIFVRLKTASGDLQRSFQFVVEPGVIEAILSKTAIFEIVAKSGDRDGQQFIVTCQFGTLGDCGRNQFTTERKPKKFIIEKTFASASSEIKKGGIISMIVDISGQGAPLDVYELRVRAR